MRLGLQYLIAAGIGYFFGWALHDWLLVHHFAEGL
jgi:hypothetical protein